MTDVKISGARIRALREHKGWTQGQLAYKADTTPAQISRIENNERPGAQAILLGKIAIALNTTTDYLVGKTNDPLPPPPPKGNGLPPEYQAKVREIVDIWRELGETSPAALLDLLNVVAGQAAMMKAAVRANTENDDKTEEEQQPREQQNT